ncbi:MAG TPA: hypothetical protein VGM06_20840 [Polyangiaceae bacterium]|jgi:hypothetical protein
MVWDPKRIRPQSWADVAEFYRRIGERNDEFRPMEALATHIAAQPYAASLQAATSGTALLVARQGVTQWVEEGLRLDVDFVGGIRFVREGARPGKPETFRSEPEGIVDAFERFLARAGWG